MFRMLDAWHQVQSYGPIIRDYAIAIGLVAAALLVAYIAPTIKGKLAALLVAAAVVSTTIAYGVGQKRGADRVKAQWDWAMQAEIKAGEDDRSRGVDRVQREPDSVRDNDPWNRDTWKLKGAQAP